MSYADRNRAIKKLLEGNFGKGNVTVRGSRGTAYGWVTVKINYAPRNSDHRREIEALIWKMFDRDGIKIGTFGTPGDMGCDYGWGHNIHINFNQCLDVFNEGETVKTCNGQTATIKSRDYCNGGDWYKIELASGSVETYYKNDLTHTQTVAG